MALNIKNTNYDGEVLESLLTVAATGNEIVGKGLICVLPNVHKKISVPRVKTGKMLQKRNKNPQFTDSKGDFDYSEKSLEPKDMMAFTVFDPSAFEHVWRAYQPKGKMVFQELPGDVQNILLKELSKQVTFELGDHYINGKHGEEDDQLFDGILTQAAKDADCIVVLSTATTMINKLKDVRMAIPKAIRNHPDLRLLMSIDDFDQYDDELTKRETKGKDETEVNAKKYKGISIESLAAWPDGVIVATLCANDVSSNLFAAVNLQDDEDVIQIDRLSNASELYFFKMLMKADTNIAFGEEFVVLDTRSNPAFTVPTEEETTDTTNSAESGGES